MVKKLAPLTGALFFVLLLVSLLVGTNSLKASSSPAKVLAYYAAHRNNSRVSGLLALLAVVVGVIFYGLLRDYLRRHEASRGLTATAFGGVILFAASGVMSTGTQWALADSPGHLSPDAAQALNLIDMDVSSPFAFAGIAILLLCFGLVIVNSGLLPKWLGWVAFPLALLAFIPPIAFVAWVGAGVWTLIVSLAMWRRPAGSDTPAAPVVAASTPT